MKKQNFTNYIILLIILLVLMYLYRLMENKRIKEENGDDYSYIRKYLLNGTLGKIKKPILWIYIPYKYNSRNWLSFGSRSSFDLNQPYLYLTVKSIIHHCKDSFHICLIDDKSFHKLIPDYKIDLSLFSNPVSMKIRSMSISKLIYLYGGMLVPISFLCMKNLLPLYEKGTIGNKMFVCENIDKNITSTQNKFTSDIRFMGSKRNNETLKDMIHYMETILAQDFTNESLFLGSINNWCERNIERGNIIKIDGMEIGIKDTDNEPILIENLMSNDYIKLYPQAYGIYIPASDILKRVKYEWFARLSAKQVLEADLIISKYMILANIPDKGYSICMGVIEPLNEEPKWVGFWQTPLVSLYGLKPNFLGDNLLQDGYPNY